MSRATLFARFPDGSVQYGIYCGTSDIAHTLLSGDPEEAWRRYREREPLDADPAGESEPVSLATDYGGGLHWTGTAARNAITADRDPYDADAGDGLPEWAAWPAPNLTEQAAPGAVGQQP